MRVKVFSAAGGWNDELELNGGKNIPREAFDSVSFSAETINKWSDEVVLERKKQPEASLAASAASLKQTEATAPSDAKHSALHYREVFCHHFHRKKSQHDPDWSCTLFLKHIYSLVFVYLLRVPRKNTRKVPLRSDRQIEINTQMLANVCYSKLMSARAS